MAMEYFGNNSKDLYQFYEVSALTMEGFDVFFDEFCQRVYDSNKQKVLERLNKNQKLFEKNKEKTNKKCC